MVRSMVFRLPGFVFVLESAAARKLTFILRNWSAVVHPRSYEVFHPSKSSVRCLLSFFSAISKDFQEALINYPSLWLHLHTAPQQRHLHTHLTCLSQTLKRDPLSICREVRIRNAKNEHLLPLPHQPILSAKPPSPLKNRTMTTGPEAQVLTVTLPLLPEERVW